MRFQERFSVEFYFFAAFNANSDIDAAVKGYVIQIRSRILK